MYYLHDVGLLCTLGGDREQVARALLTPDAPLPVREDLFQPCFGSLAGAVRAPLPPLPDTLARYRCRNNQLAAAALAQIAPALEDSLRRHGPARIGVVMATSTSGIDTTQAAVAADLASGAPPPDFHPASGMLGGLGEFVAAHLGVGGPVFTVSTACSSGGNALLSARRLLRLGVCDAVVVGGVDSLCELTVRGFAALEAVSAGLCAPFAAARDGINVGEAAAVFLLEREPGPVRLAGGAASSDAHHISAPHPEGAGAIAAMRGALADAGLAPADIGYLNLHGTGTAQNDAMESRAVHQMFGADTPCSSTKAWTGHTLGAAASLELALCWLLLRQRPARLPPSAPGLAPDPALAKIALTGHNDAPRHTLHHCMSNAFAFGGNNVSLVLSSTDA